MTIMKKYILPTVEIIDVETQQMLATSTLNNIGGVENPLAPEFDFSTEIEASSLIEGIN